MVNTFIISRKTSNEKIIPNYKKSAKCLDTKRLRKQCLEATQILRILMAIHTIADLENWDSCPYPEDEKDLCPGGVAELHKSRLEWMKSTSSRYLKLPYRYGVSNNKHVKYDKDNLPYVLYRSSIYEEQGSDIVVWIKKSEYKPSYKKASSKYDLTRGRRFTTRLPVVFDKSKIIYPHEALYTLGYSQHAAVKMWVGYEESLMYYINCHVAAYKKRKTKTGKHCNILLPTYYIEDEESIIHPWWITKTKHIVMSHRASLLRKDIDYYSKVNIIQSVHDRYKKRGYIWPSNLDEDTIVRMIKHLQIDFNKICSKI